MAQSASATQQDSGFEQGIDSREAVFLSPGHPRYNTTYLTTLHTHRAT